MLCIATFNPSAPIQSLYRLHCLPYPQLSLSPPIHILTTCLKIVIVVFGNFSQFLVATLVCQGHTSSLTPDPTTSLQPENLVYRSSKIVTTYRRSIPK
ncbi:hypothetical protein HN51_041088 [Arachis hypogaea]